MSLRIQKRDLDVLKYVFAFRVASYEQIRARHFAKNADSAARRRISLLTRAGLLYQSALVHEKKTVKIVGLRERAWPLISARWPFEIDNPLFKTESPDHDYKLASVASRFESLDLFGGLITENLLQSSSYFAQHDLYKDLVRIHADGALTLRAPDGTSLLYGLELEITRKSPERYASKLSSYYSANGIEGVIYVCGTQEIADLISKTDRIVRTGNDSIVYLGLEQNVRARSGKLFFKNVDKHGLKLF